LEAVVVVVMIHLFGSGLSAFFDRRRRSRARPGRQPTGSRANVAVVSLGVMASTRRDQRVQSATLVVPPTVLMYSHQRLVRMIARPDHLIIRPNLRGAPMDPLSETLRSVRLSGGMFLSGHFTAPWCISVEITPTDCAPFLKSPTHVITYHFVSKGRLVVVLEGQPPFEVEAGEIVLFPQNAPHTLACEAGLKPVSAGQLIQRSEDGGLDRIRHGGGGAATEIFCGFLASEDNYNPLMSTLPRALKTNVREGATREWIEASVRFAAAELAEGKLASSSVISRLSESLLTEAVREYSSTLAEGDLGWLNGVKDPQVGRALALLHHDLSAPWSVETLAKEVGVSRSAFVDRFTSLVGMPPIRYLTVWRLQTAKHGLREPGKTIAQLAYSVGYESEEAFSRAFKREFGLPPAKWRDQYAME
jgi:AraC-like DNA-binding protein/mannose-6-phosphate isomerase-like protein (cupin superfamily)